MAVVHGTFTVGGTIRVYVNADYATYYGAMGAHTVHEFRIVVRLQSYAGRPAGKHGPEVTWSFERELVASATRPAFTTVGELNFEVPGLEMAAGGNVQMTLTTARWNRSPEQGREDWPTVLAEVSALTMCATDLMSPTPPPQPPSPPPSPPPPVPPPPSPPPPSPPPPSPPPPPSQRRLSTPMPYLHVGCRRP